MVRPPQLNGNKAARSELRQRVYELKLEGRTYRQIGKELGIAGVATVSRLLHEQIAELEVPLLMELREREMARLDSWAERLEESYEQALAGDRVEVIAALAASAVKLSESARKILSVDIQPEMKMLHGAIANEAPPTPKLSEWVKEYESSELEKRMEQERNADG